MKIPSRKVASIAIFVVIATVGLGHTILMTGQEPAQQQKVALPDDWTHHRLVFSNPGTAAEALAAGRYEQWSKLTNDPRYQMQQLKRSLQQRKVAAAPDFFSRNSILQEPASYPNFSPFRGRPPQTFKHSISKDWNMNLGASSSATLTAIVGSTINSTTLPASSSFTLDGVTFNSSDPVAATKAGTFSGNPTGTQTVVISNPATSGSMTLTASPGTPGTQVGTFSSVPISSSGAITIVNGSNTLTVTTNATPANATGTFASFPLSTSSITINPSGNALTLAPNGTGAHATGTFSAAPLSTSTISITSGANTLVMTPAGTKATIVGTAAAAPATNTTVTLTSQANTLVLSNGGTFADVVGTFTASPLKTATISLTSGANTLVMTPAGTGATATGTFTGVATAGNTVTITSAANTLVLTAGSSATITVSGRGSSGDTLVVGSTTYTFEFNCGATANCISRPSGATNTQMAGNIVAAIMDSTADCTSIGTGAGCFANISTANASASATLPASGTVITLNNLTGSAVTLTTTNSNLALSGSTIPAPSNGCTSSTVGTFIIGSSAATQASDLSTAITNCDNSFAAVGATSSYTASNTFFTITDAYPGAGITFTLSDISSAFSWGSVTAGTNGSSSCTSASVGSFATSSSSATLASNLSAAINTCDASFTAVGAGSVYTSGSAFTVTAATLGAITFSAADTNTTTPATFSWSAVVAGSNGSNACSTSTAGTYAATQTVATFASNLSAAINACNTSFAAVGATSSYTASNTFFTVTDAYPGSGPTFSGSQTNATGIFSWGSVFAGTNGSNSCSSSTAGAYATSTATATLASNLATAINACNTSFAAVGATATYTSGSGFTLADAYPGAAINTFTATDANTTSPLTFAWSAVTAGTNGSNSCTGSVSPFTATFATNGAVGTLASNAAAAINLCNAALGATAATTSGGSFKVSTTALDNAVGTLTTGVSNGAGIFTWGATVAGTAGSNGCTGSTVATYQYNSTLATLANNFITALNLCTGSTGITTTSSNVGPAATVTASTWTASPGVTLSPTAAGYFSWAGSNIAGGTSGTNTGAFFAIDNVNSDAATNLAAAIVRNNGTVGVTAAAATATVTVTAASAGTTGNGITTTSNLTGFTAWSGTLAGGSDGTTDANDFAYWSGSTYAGQSAIATNIATALGLNSTITGAFTVGTANSPATGDIVLTFKAGGAGGNSQALTPNFTALTGGTFDGGSTAQATAQYPAKYSFSTNTAGLCSNATMPDYVVYNTNVPGSGSQANVVAYDNIYTGCPAAGGAATVPLVYWAYQTGSGAVPTSPVLSLDGTKVAFVESNDSTGNSTLRIIQWKSGDGTDSSSPVTPTNSFTNTTAGAGGNTAWSSCPAGASCMISVAFQTQSNTDGNSSPWYDYNSDTLYVGDDGGYLHKFTGVFLGSPGEVTTAFPIAVRSGQVLTGPVLDSSTGNIFVGSGDGFIERTTTAGVTPIVSGQLGFASGIDINDSPIVDSSAGRIYTFVSKDSAGLASRVFQLAETFAAGTTGTYEYVFPTSTTTPVFAGDFDNTYYTSSNAASPTGHLWFCAGSTPILQVATINANAFSNPSNATTAGPTLSGATTPCSPVTEFFNGTNDYIFVSPQTQSGTATAGTGCTANQGCVLSYTVSGTTATHSGAGAFAGGAGGMVVDTQNTTVSGALQIYFGILGSNSCTGAGGAGTGTGGCAIQASQAAP